MVSPVKKESCKVFMYGTLKTDQPNYFRLCDPENGTSRLLGTAKTRDKFPLVVATKHHIPFLLNKQGTGHEISGQIFEVDEKMLQFLDDFEEHPNVYQRVEVNVMVESVHETAGNDLSIGPYTCYGYLMSNYPPSWLELPHLQTYDHKSVPGEYNEDDLDTLEQYLTEYTKSVSPHN